MKDNRKSILGLCLIALLAGLLAMLCLPKVSAQQYFTNNALINGPYQYNQAYPSPIQSAQTIAAQYTSGTLAGIIPAGTVPYQGYYTNTFSTNIYLSPPVVILTISTTNGAAAVITTTPTNFVMSLLATNNTVYWEATGH